MRFFQWILSLLFATENKLDWCNSGEGRALRAEPEVVDLGREYREVRDGEVLEPGHTVKMDLKTGRTFVKL